jgi:hypothetical protein
MSFWSAVVAIAAIIAFTATRIARYRAGLGDPPPRRRMVDTSAEALASSSELHKQLDDLRKRVAVLERIATEDHHGKAVAAEIESLRDR